MATKKIKDVEVYSMSGIAAFKGFIKNGLDSSVLINIIVVFDSEFEEFKKRGFTSPPNLFYYHEISRNEVIGVLINKHNFSKNEAIKSFDKLIQKFNLTKLQRNNGLDMPFERIVEHENHKLVQRFNDPRLKIGGPDIIIIAGFLSNKINFVHSADNAFLKTCQELKINVLPTPTRDLEKENEIKKWLKKK